MTFRTLSVLATALLLGCGSDGATVAEFDEDTGAGIVPGDTGSTDETAGDTGTAPPGDTMMTPADTMMTPVDAPADTPASSTTMRCGTFNCTVGAQDCCVLSGGIGACVTKGASCAGARWGCTQPANCPSGQVCCVSGAGSGGGSCTASGMCPSTTACLTNADCSGSMKNCTDIGAGIKACSK